jgi:hypothetical protein
MHSPSHSHLLDAKQLAPQRAQLACRIQSFRSALHISIDTMMELTVVKGHAATGVGRSIDRPRVPCPRVCRSHSDIIRTNHINTHHIKAHHRCSTVPRGGFLITIYAPIQFGARTHQTEARCLRAPPP